MITFIVYMCLDFPQHWTKLDTTIIPRPQQRHNHAACCMSWREHPLLLVGVGDGGSGVGILRDMWVLDIARGVWSEVSGWICASV